MRFEIEIKEAIHGDLNKIARISSVKQRKMENAQGASIVHLNVDTGYEAGQRYEQRNVNPENTMFHSCSMRRVHQPGSATVGVAPLDGAEPGVAK